MKKLSIILLSLLSFTQAMLAQRISLTGFAKENDPCSVAQAAAARTAFAGSPCSVVIIYTDKGGWTFEAGEAGIEDIIYEEGKIMLVLPCEASEISLTSPSVGSIRSWKIPVTLLPGCVYGAKVTVEKPAPAPAKPVKPAKPVMPVNEPTRQVKEKEYSTHFFDVYAGSVYDVDDRSFGETYYGMQYTWMGHRAGAYFSAAFSDDEGTSLYAGASLRLSGSCDADLQLYGGVGIIEGCAPGLEAGIRLGWRSTHSISHWDITAGCQVWEGLCVTPTIGVGLYIWGVPVTIGLGICCLVMSD